MTLLLGVSAAALYEEYGIGFDFHGRGLHSSTLQLNLSRFRHLMD
jgi:hypothetical protein